VPLRQGFRRAEVDLQRETHVVNPGTLSSTFLAIVSGASEQLTVSAPCSTALICHCECCSATTAVVEVLVGSNKGDSGQIPPSAWSSRLAGRGRLRAGTATRTPPPDATAARRAWSPQSGRFSAPDRICRTTRTDQTVHA
jgi:hypothetical protein